MINLSIVVPCYNEELIIEESFNKLKKYCQNLQKKQIISLSSRIYFVDDGSSDRTWDIIEELKRKENMAKGIKLSRNTGHQNALLAGLSVADGDIVLTIDADLQDDIQVIEKMIKNYLSGDAIVYGVRKSRKSDSLFKKWSALLFYRLMHFFEVDIVYNHADFRLMSRKALECLNSFPEKNIFLRGVVPLIGFNSSHVYYNRQERLAGETKYPFLKMLAFAWDGITSFSVVPLRLISLVGVFISSISFFIAVWVLWVKFFQNTAIPGWASLLLPILFFSGIQLLSLGVAGEYIGKIYNEVKSRPRYFIEKQ